MNFFRARRDELDLTQRDIALALGMTDKAVSSWERGESVPRRSIEVDVARVYKVSLDRLQEEIRKLTAAAAAVA